MIVIAHTMKGGEIVIAHTMKGGVILIAHTMKGCDSDSTHNKGGCDNDSTHNENGGLGRNIPSRSVHSRISRRLHSAHCTLNVRHDLPSYQRRNMLYIFVYSVLG